METAAIRTAEAANNGPQRKPESRLSRGLYRQHAAHADSQGPKRALATLRSWKRRALEQGDDWDKLRAANLLAGEGMEAVARQTLSDYVLQHKALMGEIIEAQDMTAREKTQALASLADSFNKMVSASRRVLPETNELSVALRVIQMLTEFVRRQFPQHAAALLEVLEPFADQVAEKGGHRG